MRLGGAVVALGVQAALASGMANAEGISNGVVKVGVLTDLTGPYADVVGPGSVLGTKLAIEDCLANECKGLKIELMSADHQNKPDTGLAIAREWIDNQKVDVFVDLTNSAIALGVANMLKERTNVVGLFTGPGTTRLTNQDCVATGFHWMYDTYSLAASPVRALSQSGIKSWYFITADYTFGHQLEKDASEVAIASGAKVVGSARHPLDTRDFASFLINAQSSGAGAIALANAGNDTINTIKQASEFGITSSQKVVALLLMLTDIRAIGLKQAQGLSYVTGFYADLDEETKAIADRFRKSFGERLPTMLHYAAYSATYHYLKSVVAAGTDDGSVVAKKMRETEIRDPVMRHASIRPDGRVVHDMYLVQAKSPAESKGEGDYEKLLQVIPADQAFRPLSESSCPLVKK